MSDPDPGAVSGSDAVPGTVEAPALPADHPETARADTPLIEKEIG